MSVKLYLACIAVCIVAIWVSVACVAIALDQPSLLLIALLGTGVYMFFMPTHDKEES